MALGVPVVGVSVVAEELEDAVDGEHVVGLDDGDVVAGLRVGLADVGLLLVGEQELGANETGDKEEGEAVAGDSDGDTVTG